MGMSIVKNIGSDQSLASNFDEYQNFVIQVFERSRGVLLKDINTCNKFGVNDIFKKLKMSI
jgi:hypothetical protein